MDEPRVHVGVSRRQRHSDGSTTDYTVNLSGIPSTASPDLLAAMMGLANTGLGMIAAELDDRLGASFGPRISPRIDASVFTGPIPEAPSSADLDAAVANAVSVQIDAETGEVITQVDAPAYDLKAEINRVAEALLGKQEPPPDRGEALDKLASDVAAESTPPTDPFKALADEAFKKLAAPSEVELADDDFDDEEIIGGIDSQTPPADDEVRDGRLVFGVVVTLPNPEWHQEELTREGGSGDGGQLKAVNSALSSSGFGGKLRHPAALAILRTFGRIDDITSVREELASINDLTKAEAHVILTWYERAAAYPDAFRELAAAVHIVSAALRKEAA